MNRRDFLRAGPLACASLPPLPFQGAHSGLKITAVRLVEVRCKRQLPRYRTTPDPRITRVGGSGTRTRPWDIYSPDGNPQPLPGLQPVGGMFDPNVPDFPTPFGGFTVEVTTDKGVTGLGRGGASGRPHVESLAQIVIGADPFDVAKLWDLMYLGTLAWGRAGAAIHAISGIDLALWDIIGKAAGMPVYKLIGGKTKPLTGVQRKASQ